MSANTMSAGGMNAPHVVVVGAGLAGLSAALECADAGARVTVVERRRRLGGLTWSFEHDGHWIDNGQHIFLRCFAAYRQFLRRIGSDDDVELQDRLDLTVLRPGRGTARPRAARLRRVDLPPPFQLGPALVGFSLLRVADRLRLGQAILALRHLDLTDPELDRETFGSWLARHGQSPLAISRLWDLIALPALNLPAAEASAAMGAKVFQTGLLTDRDACDIGWSRVPLGLLHGERAAAALAKAGATILSGERVRRIDALDADPINVRPPDVSQPHIRPYGSGAATGKGGRQRGGFAVRTEEGTIDADAVIVAVPHTEAASVLPPEAFPQLPDLPGLGSSPIVDVHLRYDRQVTTLPLAAALDSRAQWIFDRTHSSGLAEAGGSEPGRGQYLAVSISAAEAEMGAHPDRLADLVADEVARVLPAAADANLLDVLVTKERHATWRAAPGTAALRPGPQSAYPGLALAGAWTDTGWPATMEGAVRSGLAAAHACLAGDHSHLPLPEEVA